MEEPKVPEFRGPVPELQFCLVCAMLAKGRAKDGQVKAPIHEAVTMGLPAVIGPQQLGGNGLIMGVVPVCWTHLMGLAWAEEGQIASPLTAPPGLLENLARGK